MRAIRMGGATLLFLSFSFGCVSKSEKEPSKTTSLGPPSVLMMILDGVRETEFTSETPSDLTKVSGEEYASRSWNVIAPEGTVVRSIRNTGITITAPAHVALVTGRVEPFGNFPIDADLGVAQYRPTVPTIFEEANSQLGLSEGESLLIANSELPEPASGSIYPEAGTKALYLQMVDEKSGKPLEDDSKVVDAVLEQVATSAPRVAVVNLHDVDRAGHYGGGNAYIDDVAVLDNALARMWTTLQTDYPDYSSNLLLMITADHGRHTHTDDDGWHNHGDSCVGCRQVPLMVTGAGVAKDAVLEDTVASIDLTTIMADHLGIEMPWAEGLPSTGVFPAFSGNVRSGEISISASGALTATQRWLDDPEHRSEVWVGDTMVSDPDAFASEAPVVLDGPSVDVVCMREQAWEESHGYMPWNPRCLANTGSGWKEIGFPNLVAPDEGQAAYWRPELTMDGDTVWAVWGYNPRSAGTEGQESRIGLSIANWTPAAGWSEPQTFACLFPTDPAVVIGSKGMILAGAVSDQEATARYTRHVKVLRVTFTDGKGVFGKPFDFTLMGLIGGNARVEHPVLRTDGDTVELAMTGFYDGGSVVAVATSLDGGTTWSVAERLPDGGPVIPGLAPAWDGDTLVWGTVVAGEAKLCRAKFGDMTSSCADVGSPRLQSFVVSAGVATVIRDAGVGQWERATVRW